MTSVAQKFLEAYNCCLKAVDPIQRKPILTARQATIIKKIYDFEENQFAPFETVAIEYNRTAERIRQIHNNGLHKIRGFASDGENECTRLIHFLEKEISSCQGHHYEKIFNFCTEHFSEVPIHVMVRLIGNLTCQNRSDFVNLTKELKSWKRKQYRRYEALKRKIAKAAKAELRTINYQNETLKQVKWPTTRTAYTGITLAELLPTRIVNQQSDYISGNYYSKKCSREVQYESTLELDFIEALESFPDVKFYLEQPVRLTYQCNGKDSIYTPDFAVFLENGLIFLVEVKDFTGMADARVHRKLECLVNYCQQHGFGVLLTNSKDSIDKLLSRNTAYLDEFILELSTRMDENNGRTILFYEFKTIQEKYDAKWTDFLSVVLKNNWSFDPFPLKLSKCNTCKFFREIFILSKGQIHPELPISNSMPWTSF